ncbi:NAD(P)-dependent nickel-iron dehydrogenase flavin-containing subunit [Longilinea arvoryzae]|uniref:NAD(P)-dependent nickel-iron dehydrogenase flavin-containing subunit n=1 Tax=Longilinea arvoryzae TaxID=360412 RepID=A0A0S7BA81_9CHLR|nr:NADH-quinone oxidoreductase subunit NuoF [Longilinea arvoryzae]GAP14318.1 NAD(P)-dependent nickel-iron dehydrogenase flavin-containing subunit [Longilinea arvoryzae]
MTHEELLEIIENEKAAQAKYKHIIHVCASTGCVSANSEKILTDLEAAIQERGLENEVFVMKVGCMGLCAAGPIVSIQPEGLLYGEMTPEDVPAILDSLDGEPIKEKLIDTNQPFFYRQEKNVLENTGQINPERIEDYIAQGGYSALLKALTDLSPNQVIKEVLDSGLRGRGGGGYPTGLKWSTVAKVGGDLKFVVCNADEGDPGAFMDRSILESDPHRVLEGMAIAAYAIGASQGVVYLRAEYPLAIKRLRTAIRQAEKMGLLGQNICNTPFSFKLDLRLGAGAFVCGEETALMQSVEGNRGMPRPRPPYPAQSGLWEHPTLINNVETFANVPNIISDGAAWFARIGTENSKGTKVFALTGKIKHTGLIEVPMGITLREIIFEIGGGIPNGRKFKAVQTGGPSGGCIPEECLDTPVDYESLKKLGSIMGSGGMIVMDESSNMIDMARFFMEFSRDESCGKCVPCRVGTTQLYEILGKFLDGTATEEDMTKLEELCDMVRNSSLCGLGQAAPNPIVSTLRYFRQEYLDKMKKEPAKAEVTE